MSTDINALPTQKKNGFANFLLKVGLVIIIILGVLFYWFYFNVYSDGDRTGTLTKISHKGNVFKTYEGEMLIGNITQGPAGLVNEKFYFSVAEKSIADTLIKMQGQRITLKYNQFRKPFIWRGDSDYMIVGFAKVQ